MHRTHIMRQFPKVHSWRYCFACLSVRVYQLLSPRSHCLGNRKQWAKFKAGEDRLVRIILHLHVCFLWPVLSMYSLTCWWWKCQKTMTLSNGPATRTSRGPRSEWWLSSGAWVKASSIENQQRPENHTGSLKTITSVLEWQWHFLFVDIHLLSFLIMAALFIMEYGLLWRWIQW